MKLTISSFQWMAFILASSLVAPIAIADLYGLSGEETAGFVQRTIFVLGISGLLQALFGHRLPINEGPAGLWWGVFTIYAGLSATMFASPQQTLQGLQGAMIASGVVFLILSITGLTDKLAKLFTPVVLGVYLLLLIVQLSGSFLTGMLGVGYRHEGVDLPIALFSIILVCFTFYLSKHRVSWVSQYSILISIAVGWCLFALLGWAKPITLLSEKFIQLPKVFAFGPPIFDGGLITTAIFITLLLLTNMIASIQVVKNVVMQKEEILTKKKGNVRRAGFVAGINQMLGGTFSGIASVPISGAAGFIATTGISKIVPFIIGTILIIFSSFSPHMMGFFASLPTPVGYSVTFVVFANMISLAFNQLDLEKDIKRIRTVVGISLLAGIGIMFVPGDAFTETSPIVTSILNNGLVFGSLIAIIVDQLTKRLDHGEKIKQHIR